VNPSNVETQIVEHTSHLRQAGVAVPHLNAREAQREEVGSVANGCGDRVVRASRVGDALRLHAAGGDRDHGLVDTGGRHERHPLVDALPDVGRHSATDVRVHIDDPMRLTHSASARVSLRPSRPER
jgi:hypothetical protein